MTASTPGHVLVVGVDGVRYDTLRQVPTPRLDELARSGFLRPVRVHGAGPTISGPTWSTIFTGALATAHGVLDNDFSSNRYADHPDVAALAGRQRPGLAVSVASGWLPLVAPVSGGPLFIDGGWAPESQQATLPEEWEVADDAVTERTLASLADHDGAEGSLAIAYLGGPDETCHLLGVGERYREFIASSDRRLGRLLDAVAARTGESWTVIVVTDHGHIDAGGHGGDSEAERTAWIAAAGPGVPTTAPEPLEQADVAAQVLATLGLEPTSPDFFGVPFGERR